MNTSRRLQFFASRLLNSVSPQQPIAIHYVVRSLNIPYCPKNLRMVASYIICRNISSGSESKAELERSSEADEDEIPTFKEFLSTLPSQEEYAKTLMKALECGKEDLKTIQNKNLYWRSLPIDTLLERIKAFEELGVQKSDLVKHSTVLIVNFEHSFQLLSSACNLLSFNGNMLFPLVLLPEKTILSYLCESQEESKHLGSYENRIKFFTDRLKIPVRLFTEELLLHHYILKIPITQIIAVMDVLLEANIKGSYIFRDLWVFRCNLQKAKERLNYCQQAGVTDIKPWIVRCSDKTFYTTVHNRKALQLISSGLSWEEFVAKLLDCSVEEVEAMVKYHRRVLKVSFLKTKRTIEYLLSEGFTSKEILQSPHVFCPSIESIEKRLKLFREAGLEPVQHPQVLRRMCMSDKAFMNTLQYFIRDTTSLQNGSMTKKKSHFLLK